MKKLISMVACVTLCGVAYADEFKMPERKKDRGSGHEQESAD